MPIKTVIIKDNQFTIWYNDISILAEYTSNSEGILQVSYFSNEGRTKQEIANLFIDYKEEIFDELDTIILDNYEYYKHFNITRDFVVNMWSGSGNNIKATYIVQTDVKPTSIEFEYYNANLTYEENMLAIWNIGKSHSYNSIENRLSNVKYYLDTFQPQISQQHIIGLIQNYEGGYKTGLSK